MADIQVEKVKAYLGIGSNIGNRLAYLEQAIQAIDNLSRCRVIERAPIYETKAQGNTDQADFLNTVIAVETTYQARELLMELQKIEVELQRVRTVRWGPRTIDIDVLFYGQACIEEFDFVVPHTRIQERDFVLTPLRALNPNWMHPKLKLTIEELHSRLSQDSAKEIAKK